MIGGMDSGVSDETVNVVLEAALFDPVSIAMTGREHGILTDARYRFERGVDPELQVIAIERATQLVLDICGGVAGPVNEVASDANLPKPQAITLRSDRIKRVLGVAVEGAEVERILNTLGLQCRVIEGGWQVTAPSFRFDINIEVDLIEEIGRIFGYDNLPTTRPSPDMVMQPQTELKLPIYQLRRILVQRGYQEAITYSFVDPKVQQVLTPELPGVALANPISSDMSVMRTTLWSGLVQALSYNANRQQDRIRLFETGRRFVQMEDELAQEPVIAGLIYGEVTPEQWAESGRKVDFYDAKGDVEALLRAGGIDDARFEVGENPALHPGQSAMIMRAGEAIGWLGKVSPVVAKKLDIPSNVCRSYFRKR